MGTTRLIPSTAILLAVTFTSCGGFGSVNQGRVIGYDAAKGVVTLISDSNPSDPEHPRYDVMPPVTVRIPGDPRQMGPLPEAGKLLHLDSANCRMVVFDAGRQALRTIRYSVTEEQHGVFPSDPLVAGRALPAVDRATRTVTIYSARARWLATISVPEDSLDLPEDTWMEGDDIRYYFKEPGQALRLMNVTKAGEL